MKQLTGSELRKQFLDYFKSKDHLIEHSYPLIPQDDPTLLIIGAGMAPFKPFFTGKMKPPHPRIATSQKCVRTGDIENVGRTARHHTFFEMLGNFSFGDYFKKEAIAWAWDFLTINLELPADKLYATIHTDDDEAYEIWLNEIKIPQERIVRMADNFWEIGPGPCGPCSEIYIDLGEERGCSDPNCSVGCDCDRYLEIWNLVFTQFEKTEAGEYVPLAKKNIDTGAGLERIASVLQNKPSNFETDLLFPIIEFTSKIANVKYNSSSKTDISLKVIADHARSMTVMISDGILPSNEGRGYVLRRLMRRAIRHARLLGIEKMFLTDTVDVVTEIFKDHYIEILENKDFIKKIVEIEEERFQNTLNQGIELLNKEILELQNKKVSMLDGDTAFKLYDTYGFPLELTQEILDEQNMTVDIKAFEVAMQAQRVRAKEGRLERSAKISIPDLSGIDVKENIYDPTAEKSKIIVLIQNGQIINEEHEISVGDEIAIILEATPFYAESGGQIADTGKIIGSFGKMEVLDTQKLPDGTIYHHGRLVEGILKPNESVTVKLNKKRNANIARNHTATHILQKALKLTLGDHINQAGSLVTEDRLRFDFTHFSAVTKEELDKVEDLVNEIILSNASVCAKETSQKEAKEMGAIALFGEKYGDIVRVVSIDDFSMELCGGTHINTTAEIGVFKIISESSIGSGIRRIEATTGKYAYEYLNKNEHILKEIALSFKCSPDEVPVKIEGLRNEIKNLEKESASFAAARAKDESSTLLANVITIGNFKVIIGKSNTAPNPDSLRSLADTLKDKIQSGVIVLGAKLQDKASFVAMATPDAVEKGANCGQIVRAAAQKTYGSGGGKPNMAQAGGKDPSKIEEALTEALEVIKKQIS